MPDSPGCFFQNKKVRVYRGGEGEGAPVLALNVLKDLVISSATDIMVGRLA